MSKKIIKSPKISSWKCFYDLLYEYIIMPRLPSPPLRSLELEMPKRNFLEIFLESFSSLWSVSMVGPLKFKISRNISLEKVSIYNGPTIEKYF